MGGGNRPCLQLLLPLKGGPPALIPLLPPVQVLLLTAGFPAFTLHPQAGFGNTNLIPSLPAYSLQWLPSALRLERKSLRI